MKKGFTLTEIIVTFAIIGFIAVVTIPLLVSSVNRRNTIEQLKKAQTVLAEAINNIILTEGSISGWVWDVKKPDYMMKNYFLPKLRTSLDCGMATDGDCVYDYTSMEKGDVQSTGNADWYKVFLTDGSFVAFTLKDASSDESGGASDPNDNGEIDTACPRNRTVMCGMFIVDVNGKNKPNKIGLDIFYFGVYSNGQLLPYGANWTEEKIDENCSVTKPGKTCAAKVAKDGWRFCDSSECPNTTPYPVFY